MPDTLVVEKGRKFWRINLGATPGNWEMTEPRNIKELRLTGIASGDYMTFYENYNDDPVFVKLDYFKAATLFQGGIMTKIGFVWASCSIADPANAILSIEFDRDAD